LDFVGDLEKKRSISSYVFTLAGGPICWMPNLQERITLSTIVAKYIVVLHAFNEGIWLKGLLGEYVKV